MPEEIIDTIDEKIEELTVDKKQSRIELFFNNLAEKKNLTGLIIRIIRRLKQKLKAKLAKKKKNEEDLDG